MVYVTGDIHGELKRLQAAAKQVKKGDSLIICGDFGFIWNGSKEERKNLARLEKLKYTILFVDGLHENFEQLSQYPVVSFAGGEARQVGKNIFHLLRGEIYELEGESYFTFGGGEEESDSFQREYPGQNRVLAIPSEEEMKRGLQNLLLRGKKVNYIITHFPSGKTSGLFQMRGMRNYRIGGLHIYLNQLEESAEFDRWFFGSLHVDKVISRRHVSVFETIHPVRLSE